VVVTATETAWIARPPEAVFDYTQDYAHRTEWDRGAAEAQVLGRDPRSVRIRVPGSAG
jgi:hypothetical protein